MKKLLIAAAALLVSISASAQFGIMGGMTSSSSKLGTAIGDVRTKNITQYHIGVTYKFTLGNVFALQPALLYQVKGTRLSDISGISDLSCDFKTGFIELPVQIQAGVGLGKLIRLYGILEPYIGLAVSNKISVDGATSSGWDNVKNRFEFGAGLGAGVEILNHIQLSARYCWDFGKVYGSDFTIGSGIKTIGSSPCNCINVSVAFLF